MARVAPRVIATDLDGTLLDAQGVVSARTRAALQRVWSLGIETVFVTARPPRWIDALADWVGEHGVAICANGAFTYDVPARRVLEWQVLQPETVRDMVTDLRAAIPGIGFAAERASGFWAEGTFAHHHPTPADMVVAPSDVVDGEIGKLLARAPHVPDRDFTRTVVEIVGDRAIVADSGASGLAEIGALGVTKAGALTRWCTARGVTPEQVWAFGDMPNDVPMLRWAGTSFAMANAHPDVVAAATYRCPSNVDDGVAVMLEELG